MKTNKFNLVWALWIIMLVLTAGVYFYLPDTIPLKWDISGSVVKTGVRTNIFVFPFMAGICILMKYILPIIDPKRSNYIKFKKAFIITISVTILLLMVLECLTIHNSFLPGSMKIEIVLPMAVGFFMTCIGNFMPQIRHNYFFGIRTPWTLENENVWTKTHRFGGLIWFINGLFIFGTTFLPAYLKRPVFLTCVAVALIFPTAYSYVLYCNINRHKK